MKILFVVQGFQQGWGGAPESVRLMARCLAPLGFSSDVFDLGRFHPSVETLDLLPEAASSADDFAADLLSRYQAILIVGPWQNPLKLRPLLAARQPRQRLLYLPRGGLARADFRRLRDLKKIPYFHLVERRLLEASHGIIFSSDHEQRDMIASARRRAPEHVIPDLFDNGPFSAGARDLPRRAGKTTFSFLAEISPLKGLLPLVEGFARWSSAAGMADRARLVAGGRVRAGSESYFKRIEAVRDHYRGAADIAFLGPVPHGDRARFYADTDVMVIPSRGESFGLTLLESFSAGCAVLASPSVGALQYMPGNGRLTVMDGGGAGAIEAGIARMFETVQTGEDQRARTRDLAARAVEAMNARALSQWSELLRGG